MHSPLQDTLQQLHARFSAVDAGEVATYIPELALANAGHFAIACATVDGHVYSTGDAETAFTIQSISKPFVYGLALDDIGIDAVAAKIGVEPSGEAFNAISLEPGSGRPRNPMINAGAIAAASLVQGGSSDEKMQRTLAMLSRFAGRRLSVDDAVYRSERDTGHRNRAISYLLRNADIVGEDVEAVVDRYFQQCSVLVTAADLALMAATLANGGRNPWTGDQVIAFDHVQNVLSVMSTCGMYDYAGSWLYRVGMPAKSGVAGGVIAVLPGQFGIGIFSPRLDTFGNSVRGVAVCEALSADFGLHLLRTPVQPTAVVMQTYTLNQSGSKRRRGTEDMRTIAERGRQTTALRLQGPLAFSTAEVALRSASEAYEPEATIVFDCARVPSMDAAAARLFQAFTNTVESSGGRVLVAGLRDDMQGMAALQGGGGPLFFASIDAALEWCEDLLLPTAMVVTQDELPLAEHPMFAELTPMELEAISNRLTRESHAPRDVIVRQGEAADAVYFVASGVASVQLNLPGERRHRLATLGRGATFGEVALMDTEPRTADVEADSDLVCYTLRLEDLAAVERVAPAVRLKLVEALARDLATRLRHADVEIMTLAS